jgi:hypothetical protein
MIVLELRNAKFEKEESMKFLLAVLGLWSAGCGIYFGLVQGSERAFEIGFTLAFLLFFVATLLAVAELPRFIRRRNRK